MEILRRKLIGLALRDSKIWFFSSTFLGWNKGNETVLFVKQAQIWPDIVQFISRALDLKKILNFNAVENFVCNEKWSRMKGLFFARCDGCKMCESWQCKNKCKTSAAYVSSISSREENTIKCFILTYISLTFIK